MKSNRLSFLSLMSVATLAVACTATTDYELNGQVAATSSIDSPITLQFFEITVDEERNEVGTQELAEPGDFSASISVEEGAKVLVRALVDSNNDGLCTEGELWAEQELEANAEGILPDASLQLSAAACPIAAADE